MHAIEQVLGFTPIMQMIEAIKPGIPNPLPPGFMNVTDRVENNVAVIHRTYGQRRLATNVPYGAPAVQAPQVKIDQVPVILAHYFEMVRMSPVVLAKLRAFDKYEFNRGKEMVALQMKNFVQRFVNTRIAASMSMLVNGKLWFNSAGNMLPSSSGADAARTVDAGISANHQSQLNGIVGTSWSTTTADILTDINQIKFQSLKDTGYEIKYAFYGLNIPAYLSQNDYVKYFLARDSAFNAEYLRNGHIPDGLFDLKWIPIFTGFFEDQDGTNQNIVANNDLVVFTPDPSPDWWGVVEGGYPVATTTDIQSDLMSALNSLDWKTGMFAFSNVALNPASLDMYHGDTFLPYLKLPDCVYQLDAVI